MREQILRRLRTDFNFAAEFLLRNNPAAVISVLRGLGYNVSNPTEALGVIKGFQRDGKVAELTAVFKVPYLNDATNGTGGLRQGVPGARFDFSFIPFVGEFINEIVYDDQGVATNPNAALLQLEAQRNADAAKAAQTQQNLIYGFGGAILLLIIGAIVYSVVTRPKTSK